MKRQAKEIHTMRQLLEALNDGKDVIVFSATEGSHIRRIQKLHDLCSDNGLTIEKIREDQYIVNGISKVAVLCAYGKSARRIVGR